jgi:hypothetical protein
VTQSGTGKTINVAANGSDSSGDGNASAPYATLARALNGAVAGDTVLIAGGDYSWPNGVMVSVSGSASNWIVIRAASSAAVTIHGSGSSGSLQGQCIGITGSYIDIEGLTCDSFPNVGMDVLTGHHIRLHGNTVSNTGNTGIGLYYVASLGPSPYQVEISNNTVTMTNMYWTNSTAGSAGEGITAWGDQLTVAYNTVQFTQGEGIGSGGTQIWVVGNTVRESCAPALYLDTASQVVLEDNFVNNDSVGQAAFLATCFRPSWNGGQPEYGTGIQVAAEVASYTDKSYARLTQGTVRNNIVSNMRIGFVYGNYNMGDGLHSWRIENNTFVGGAASASLINVPTGTSSANDDVVFANNIFYWPSTASAIAVSNVGITYTHDLWFGASASNAASSGDVGGNPNLSNPSGINPANYVPLAGSLAHGAGTPTYAPATDYFGNPRSPTSTDIGAALVP